MAGLPRSSYTFLKDSMTQIGLKQIIFGFKKKNTEWSKLLPQGCFYRVYLPLWPILTVMAPKVVWKKHLFYLAIKIKNQTIPTTLFTTIFAKNDEGFVKHWEQHVDGIVHGSNEWDTWFRAVFVFFVFFFCSSCSLLKNRPQLKQSAQRLPALSLIIGPH